MCGERERERERERGGGEDMEGNIGTYFKEKAHDNVGWIHLVHDRLQRMAIVNVVINLGCVGPCIFAHSNDRPRLTALLPPRSYGKPETAAAVDRLLMMGIRMRETC